MGGVNTSAVSWSGSADITRRCLPASSRANVQVVELGAVVVADQAGRLLEMRGLELHDRRRAEAMRLLPPRDERLREQAADGLAAEEAQMARAGRAG